MQRENTFPYEFVLLDFDGLLVDTEPFHYKAYMQMIEERGLVLSWSFAEFCLQAHSKAQGVFVFLEEHYPELFEIGMRGVLYERKKVIYEELLQTSSLSLMPGAEDFLRYLAENQISRAVVTNSPLQQIEWIKAKISMLQTIPLFVTRENYTHPKPSPEGYLLAQKHLGMMGKKGIGFEDTRKGVESLLAAQLDAVWVGKSPEQRAFEQEDKVLYWSSLEEFSCLL